MKAFGIVISGLIWLALGCGDVVVPIPVPDPSPGDPAAGFDCSEALDLSGVVEVDDQVRQYVDATSRISGR